MSCRRPSAAASRAWCVSTKTGVWNGGFSPHQPRHDSSPQSPRIGPNMLRPMIEAPAFSNASRRTSSLTPVSPPPASPCISRNVFSANTQSCQTLGSLAYRTLEALVRPGDIPIDRHRDLEPELAHGSIIASAHRGTLGVESAIHMAFRYVLAIDLGTSGLKAALVSESGDVAARASRAIATHLIPPNGAEQDPDEIWAAVTGAIREVAAGAPRESIVAVTCASQYFSIVPVGADGKAAGPLLLWLDGRGGPQAMAIYRRHPAAFPRWMEIHGIPPQNTGADSLSKMLWVQAERPEMYEKTRCFLEPVGLRAGAPQQALHGQRLHRLQHAAHQQQRPLLALLGRRARRDVRHRPREAPGTRAAELGHRQDRSGRRRGGRPVSGDA